jgi:hypothetical protein
MAAMPSNITSTAAAMSGSMEGCCCMLRLFNSSLFNSGLFTAGPFTPCLRIALNLTESANLSIPLALGGVKMKDFAS